MSKLALARKHPMTTVEQLIQLSARRFKVEAGSLKATQDIFQSLGIDSMHVLELLTEVEMEFDIEIPDYELRDVKTFDELAACIDRRL